ncbi:hypothetical protein N7I30_16495 [Aurantimonas litoralis]|nr:hypothetical protein [Aurantimonas litoralis]
MPVEVDVKDTSPEMAKFLSEALSGDYSERSEKVANGAGISPISGQGVVDPTARLPRRIDGGFVGLGHDLDRHGRECRNAVRLMEQLRPPLEAAESERVRLHQSLTRIVPEVDENGRSLSGMIESARKGDVSGDLSAKFSKSAAKLDELESLAEALNANLMAVRSAWEQYARAAIQAQRLRETHKSHRVGAVSDRASAEANG